MKKILMMLLMLVLLPSVVSADVVMPTPLEPEYYLYNPELILYGVAFITGVVLVIIFIVNKDKKKNNNETTDKEKKK